MEDVLDEADKRAMVEIVAVLAGAMARDAGFMPKNFSLSDAQKKEWLGKLYPHFTVEMSETTLSVKYDPLGLMRVSPLYAALPGALGASNVKQSIVNFLKKSPRFEGKEIVIG